MLAEGEPPSLLLEPQGCGGWIFAIVPEFPGAVLSFFGLFCLLFRMGKCYCSVLKFMDSFLCHLHSAVEPIH